MNPIRLFALQSARVPPFDMQPGATGAPEIDSAIAAAMCAGMPERWYKAAMLKWGGDEAHRQWLFIELWMATMELARRNKWDTKKEPVRCGSPSLTALAVAGMDVPELDDYEQMINRTTGVRMAYIIADIAVAEIADPGRWDMPHHWTKKAVALGVGKSAWFDTWSDRVAAARQILDGWAGEGYAYVRRRQRGRKRAA